MARFVVDYASHLLERDRKIPGDARHHRIGVSLCDHRGAEIVAVLIDEALAISKKVAFALQPFVQELRVERVALGKPCVMNLDALVREVEPRRLCDRPNALLAPDQDRSAEPLSDK